MNRGKGLGAKQFVIYACDVGSIKEGNFAWTSSNRGKKGSRDIEELVGEIVRDLSEEKQIAIGFECPLFIPCPDSSEGVGKARSGEERRPYTASPGACAAITGLSEMAWVFNQIHERMPDITASVSWEHFLSGEARLFIWEAFVSEKSRPTDHIEDAYQAMMAFQKNIGGLQQASCVDCVNPVSFAGAIILWSGMSEDLALLKKPCIVIRPGDEVSVNE